MKILQTGSTCSAAVLQKLLAEYSPELYRQIVMSLYEKENINLGDYFSLIVIKT